MTNAVSEVPAGIAVPRRLAGRHILLTGAASGIGKATASLLAREGAAVALLDVHEDSLRAVALEIGGSAHPVDLRDAGATIQSVSDAAKALGGIDGVINCAGIANNARLGELTLEVWTEMLMVNMTAPYLICRAALPWLRRRAGSTIVNVASGQAILPNIPGATAYAASKGGLLSFTKALASDLAPDIRANVICPGIVNTPMVSGVLGGYDDPNTAPFVSQYTLRRVAAPVEIAQAILFLTSDESSYVTGTALAVDGGRTFH